MTDKQTPHLFHVLSDSDETFFKRIEEYGGWPMDKQFLTLCHECATERRVYFGNDKKWDGWNTTIYERDDYLWWKLSATRKKLIEKRTKRLFAQEMISLSGRE